jgi:hypothetical protein
MEDTTNRFVLKAYDPPTLKSTSREKVVAFVDGANVYIDKMKETGHKDYSWSYRANIRPKLLRSICEYELGVPVALVTEKQLEEYLEGIINKTESQITVLEDILGRIKMDMSVSDPEARCLDLFARTNELVRNARLEKAMTHKKVYRKVETAVIDAIRPKSVRDLVKQELLLADFRSLKDLYPEVKKAIVDQHKYHIVSTTGIEYRREERGKNSERQERHEKFDKHEKKDRYNRYDRYDRHERHEKSQKSMIIVIIEVDMMVQTL